MPIRCGNHQGSPSPVYHADIPEVRACCQGAQVQYIDSPGEQKAAVAPIEITQGMWYIGERIIKVQRAVHGSQHLYTKELVKGFFVDDGWKFERLHGGMKELRNSENVRKMTLEEAMQFGKLYGQCCRCGKTLTDENSIENGIGPICAGKI